MEPFNYMGSLITSVARCTLEIKLMNAMGKSALNKNTTICQQIGLKM